MEVLITVGPRKRPQSRYCKLYNQIENTVYIPRIVLSIVLYILKLCALIRVLNSRQNQIFIYNEQLICWLLVPIIVAVPLLAETYSSPRIAAAKP